MAAVVVVVTMPIEYLDNYTVVNGGDDALGQIASTQSRCQEKPAKAKAKRNKLEQTAASLAADPIRASVQRQKRLMTTQLQSTKKARESRRGLGQSWSTHGPGAGPGSRCL